MLLEAAFLEKLEKIEDWINGGEEYQLLDWEDLGLKDGAPEEAKAAYEEYLAMVQRRRETGRM